MLGGEGMEGFVYEREDFVLNNGPDWEPMK